MRMNLKSLLLICILIVTLSFLPALVHAQGGPGDPGCDPLDPKCPIDGGLSLLLAAGIGYGIIRIWATRKKEVSISQVLD